MRKERAAALKIALILEEYSKSELRLAVKILRGSGREGILLNYVEDEQKRPSRDSKRSEIPSTRQSSSETKSRAISRLENSDPEKFGILREFEKLIQAGEVLKTNEAVRNIGDLTGKKFVVKKSRKESIAALLVVLAESNIEDIRNFIKAAIAPEERVGGDQYQRLADFLIKGKG